MTRIDFYVVGADGYHDRLSVAARLTDKASERGHRVYINCESETQARTMDALLWSYRPDSFIAHAPGDTIAPVTIDWTGDPGQHNDVLINLQPLTPEFFSRFERVAEVVTQQPEYLPALREAWRFYKDRGYPLHKHDL